MKPREFWILPNGLWMRLCEKDDFKETTENIKTIEKSAYDKAIETLKHMNNQINDLKTKQDKLLGQGFTKACKHWNEATSLIIDFNPVYQTLKDLDEL